MKLTEIQFKNVLLLIEQNGLCSSPVNIKCCECICYNDDRACDIEMKQNMKKVLKEYIFETE